MRNTYFLSSSTISRTISPPQRASVGPSLCLLCADPQARYQRQQNECHLLRPSRQPRPRSLQQPGLPCGRAAMPRTTPCRRSGAGQRRCCVRTLWPLPLQARHVLLPRGLLQQIVPGSPRGAWSRPALPGRLAWRRRSAAGGAARVWRGCRALPAPRGPVGRRDSCGGCTWQQSACDGGGSAAGCKHGRGRSVGRSRWSSARAWPLP